MLMLNVAGIHTLWQGFVTVENSSNHKKERKSHERVIVFDSSAPSDCLGSWLLCNERRWIDPHTTGYRGNCDHLQADLRQTGSIAIYIRRTIESGPAVGAAFYFVPAVSALILQLIL